ncbi:MAG: DUF481 domain-containing protein [Syntrophales bacterium]|nr:DUF481 domain-containing protein [Syntrophales bacterium]MDY0044886.1 DUF481 domain-containing protein [Syntrophales bacterium]
MNYKSLVCAISIALMMSATPVNAQVDEEGEAGPWKVRAELAYINSSGNTDADALAARLRIKKEEAVNRYYLDASLFRAEDEENETGKRWLIDGRYERVIGNRFFWLAEAYYMKDKYAGYDYRYGFGPGIGYEVLDTDTHYLKGMLSFLYSYDRYWVGPYGSESYLGIKAAIEYTWNITEDLVLKEDAFYHFSLEDIDTFFLSSETALEMKITDTIALAVSYIISYQHNEPAGDIDEWDRLFLTSVIFEF